MSAQAASEKRFDTLIVGAGQAGSAVAAELRSCNYGGTIALVGAEDVAPYERPPLSKAYLTGDMTAEQLRIRGDEFWAKSEVELVTNTTITGLEAKTAWSSDGRAFGYGTLVWATGGEPRRLGIEGESLPGVHVLRTLDDARGLRAVLEKPGIRLVVVGAGYLGLEVAAVFASHGATVTVVEIQGRILQRVTGEEVSAYLHRTHEKRGVRILLDTQVVAITADAGRVTGVRVASGDRAEEVIAADHVLMAVGVVPRTDLLERAGAEVSNGIIVDEVGRTTLSNVYAVGDCANLPYALHPTGRVRLESVQGANDLGKIVGRHIAGAEIPAFPTPWFWSNQYDLKLKTVGVCAGYDRTIIRGDPADDSFSVLYLKENLLLAVDTVNLMRDYVATRPIVGQCLDLGRAADPAVRLGDAVIPV